MSDILGLLPYETPESQKEAALMLADIVGIPERIVPGTPIIIRSWLLWLAWFYTGT